MYVYWRRLKIENRTAIKSSKIWLFVVGFLVVAGSVMFAAVMAVNDWEFMKLNTTKYEAVPQTTTGGKCKITVSTGDIDMKIQTE